MHPILRELDALRAREHECTVQIVETLLACDREKLHLTLGHGSLWQFLVERLRYSHAAAWRRVAAVRCIQRWAPALAMLREGRTNLCCLASVAPLLDRVDDAPALFARIDGRSQREVEALLAELRPTARPRERMQRVAVRTTTGANGSTTAQRAATAVVEAPSQDADLPLLAPKVTSAAEVQEKPATAPPVEARFQLGFSIDARTHRRLERARALLSRKHPRGVSLEVLMIELLEGFLRANDPVERQRRRAQREQRRKRGAVGLALEVEAAKPFEASNPSTSAAEVTSSASSARSRHIPARTRDAVFARDGLRCTYVGPQGHRCTNAHDLELDHVEPYARGGSHEAHNLRVLCGAHNRHRAREDSVSGSRT